MPRSAIRWVFGAAAGILVSSGLANGTAQALPALGGLTKMVDLGGLTKMADLKAVTGLIPAGE